MTDHNLLSVINTYTFHMNSTNSIPLYSHPTLGIITIVFYVSALGMHPSQNASFVKLIIYTAFVVWVIFPVLLPLATPSDVPT